MVKVAQYITLHWVRWVMLLNYRHIYVVDARLLITYGLKKFSDWTVNVKKKTPSGVLFLFAFDFQKSSRVTHFPYLIDYLCPLSWFLIEYQAKQTVGVEPFFQGTLVMLIWSRKVLSHSGLIRARALSTSREWLAVVLGGKWEMFAVL